MVKGRTSQNETVENSDGHTQRDTFFQCTQHAARTGAVNVELLTHPSVDGWNNIRLSVNGESNVTVECLVEDCRHRGVVIGSTCWSAAQRGAFCRCEP